jgi:hypothetical protein
MHAVPFLSVTYGHALSSMGLTLEIFGSPSPSEKVRSGMGTNKGAHYSRQADSVKQRLSGIQKDLRRFLIRFLDANRFRMNSDRRSFLLTPRIL